jgi:hypothetical protein
VGPDPGKNLTAIQTAECPLRYRADVLVRSGSKSRSRRGPRLRDEVRIRRFGVLLALVIVALLPVSVAWASHGGEFTLNSRAADPTTYEAVFPAFTSCPAGGRAADPIPGAQYATGVNSLTPSTMVLGEIVPFEFRIAVGSSSPADSSIEFTATWDTVTTPSGDFGFSDSYLVYCTFVDTAESTDPDGDASAAVSSALMGTQIEGTFQVSGLDANDVVVVEAWVVLDSSVPPAVSGNVQARMIDAQTLTPDVDTINVGAETTNLQPDENFQRAIMVVKQIASGSDSSQTFGFSGDVTATLGDGQVSTPLIVTDGSYSVTEAVPEGWDTPTIACDDDDSGGDGPTATFNVDLETIVCTFTNAEAAPASTTTTAPTTTTTAGITTSTTLATTTTAAVASPTLPFTGLGSTVTAGLGLSLIAAGGLILALRTRRES